MEWRIDPGEGLQRLHAQMASAPPQADEDARRLFHGRGHCYEGLTFLTIDWYAPVVLITLFQDPGDEWLAALIDGLHTQTPWEAVACVVVQKRFLKGSPSEIGWGTLPAECEAREDGMTYQIALNAQQNIGFFIDMRNARRWLQEHAAGKRVLNLFAFTCAFSVVALAHGAESVTNLDMSRTALATGRVNHERNQLDVRNAHFWGYDLFRSWGRLRKFGPFDLVICDPPSFQRGSFVAKKDYGRVLKRLDEITSPGAQILACLNAPSLDFAFLRECFARHAPAFAESDQLAPPDDFPEREPDRGLKLLVFTKQDTQL